MIRPTDPLGPVDQKPAIAQQAADPLWKRASVYLDSWGAPLYYVSKGCDLSSKVAQLALLHPAAGMVGQGAGSLGRLSQVANFMLATEKFAELNQEGKVGLDLASIKELLGVSGKGVGLSNWLASIEKLGLSLKIIGSLSSVGLAIGLLAPTINLIIHLRAEGRNAFGGVELYKNIFQLGNALLAIYLFSTALTLSALVETLLAGADIVMS